MYAWVTMPNDILRDMVYIIHDFREDLIDFENFDDRCCFGGAVKDWDCY